ncbi:ribonuclease H-like domain-containing protein [Tanacetum coccineum]
MIRELITNGVISIEFERSQQNLADHLMKGLARDLVIKFAEGMGLNAVNMSANPVQHQRTKDIEIDIHFVRDKVATVHVRVLHVPSRFQYADIFTKGLPYPLFADFRSSLSVCKSLALTAGAY